MAIASARTLLTPEEYLVKEREAEFRVNTVMGQIVMMPVRVVNMFLLQVIYLVNCIYNCWIELVKSM